MTRDDIIERVYAQNWQQVIGEFAGLTPAQVLAELNYISPREDNSALAAAIILEVNRPNDQGQE